MGLLENLSVLLSSTARVGHFIRDVWFLLPFAVQVLIIVSFASIIIIAMINKI